MEGIAMSNIRGNTTISNIIWIIIVPLFVLACFYLWKAERWMHYKTSYQSRVEEQINNAMQEHIKKYHLGEVNSEN